jgi:hypothetical protein
MSSTILTLTFRGASLEIFEGSFVSSIISFIFRATTGRVSFRYSFSSTPILVGKKFLMDCCISLNTFSNLSLKTFVKFINFLTLFFFIKPLGIINLPSACKCVPPMGRDSDSSIQRAFPVCTGGASVNFTKPMTSAHFSFSNKLLFDHER